MTDTTRPQAADPDPDAVIAFLGSGAKDGTTKRVDTHISIVFLEPHRVLKIKRALRLPFLDYSTLDKRKRACEDEIDINRRYAPEIYRRVVPITRGPQGLEIGLGACGRMGRRNGAIRREQNAGPSGTFRQNLARACGSGRRRHL
jgi:hypothetical protein